METKETLKIYHSNNDSVPKLKALVKDHFIYSTIDFNILEDKFTPTRLLQLTNKLRINLEEIVNKDSDFYKKNIAKSKFDEADWVRVLIKHPELIKTPIVETEHEAMIIDNPRDILKLNKTEKNINGYNHTA